jgi:hypothetical protein
MDHHQLLQAKYENFWQLMVMESGCVFAVFVLFVFLQVVSMLEFL